MKLLLTSDGLSSKKIKKEFLRLLDKPAAENKILVMHTWQNIKTIVKGLITLGIKKENIISVNIRHKVSKIPEFDVFYSLGGNTFYILDRVRKTGFDKIIKKSIKQGKLYIGLSAGSILIGPDISISFDENSGFSTKGLNLIKIIISPHFNKKRVPRIKSFIKKMRYPIVPLKDKQALLINGKTKRLIK